MVVEQPRIPHLGHCATFLIPFFYAYSLIISKHSGLPPTWIEKRFNETHQQDCNHNNNNIDSTLSTYFYRVPHTINVSVTLSYMEFIYSTNFCNQIDITTVGERFEL